MDLPHKAIDNLNSLNVFDYGQGCEMLHSWNEVRRDLFLHFNEISQKLYNIAKDGPVPMDEGLCQWPANESLSTEVCANVILDTATKLKAVADHMSKVGMVLQRMLIIANNKSIEKMENSREQQMAELQAGEGTTNLVVFPDTGLPSSSPLSSLVKRASSDCVRGVQGDVTRGCGRTGHEKLFWWGWGSGLKALYNRLLTKEKIREKLYNLRMKTKELLVQLEAIETKETATIIACTETPIDLSINKAPKSQQLTPIIEPMLTDCIAVKAVTTRRRGRPARRKLSGRRYACSLKALYKSVQPIEMADMVANIKPDEAAEETEKSIPPVGATDRKVASPNNPSLPVEKASSSLPVVSKVQHKPSGYKNVRGGPPRGRGRPSRAKFLSKSCLRILKKVKKNACAKPMTRDQIFKLALKLESLNLDQAWQFVELIKELEPEYKRQNNKDGSATYDFIYFQPATLHHIKRFANACLRDVRKVTDEQKTQGINGYRGRNANMKNRDDGGVIVNSIEDAQNDNGPSNSGVKVIETRRSNRKQTHAQFFKWKKLSDSSGSSNESN